MIIRDSTGWQLILADLALILFLVTIAALAETSEQDTTDEPAITPREQRNASIAPAQALYRPGPSSPSIDDWLHGQTVDPRATLSVIATHREGEAEVAWSKAKELAAKARAHGIAVRVVVMQAAHDDLYASLAYDTPR